MKELPDNISVCSECGKHTNDDRGETKWSKHSDPYCGECISTGDWFGNTIDKTDEKDFKCNECGTKYPESFCATDDVSLCRWCSGEETEAGILE